MTCNAETVGGSRARPGVGRSSLTSAQGFAATIAATLAACAGRPRVRPPPSPVRDAIAISVLDVCREGLTLAVAYEVRSDAARPVAMDPPLAPDFIWSGACAGEDRGLQSMDSSCLALLPGSPLVPATTGDTSVGEESGPILLAPHERAAGILYRYLDSDAQACNDLHADFTLQTTVYPTRRQIETQWSGSPRPCGRSPMPFDL